jgi:hypothetical protein
MHAPRILSLVTTAVLFAAGAALGATLLLAWRQRR